MTVQNIDVPKLTLNNIRDEVYNVLRERILSHAYPPGFRFDLPQLEQQLGVSRTPLKEALHRLELEGLIEIRPRRGTYVTRIDLDDVAECFAVRQMLECAASSLIVANITPDDIEDLIKLSQEMSQLLTKDDYQTIVSRYIELDRQFHRQLINFAQNKRLSRIYDEVDTHLQIAHVRQKFSLADSMQFTEPEHQAILQAVQALDGVALSAAFQAHAERAVARMIKVLTHDD
ncbi:MAG: GntR family transcriptional regulator [Chloroflexota bacterium]